MKQLKTAPPSGQSCPPFHNLWSATLISTPRRNGVLFGRHPARGQIADHRPPQAIAGVATAGTAPWLLPLVGGSSWTGTTGRC